MCFDETGKPMVSPAQPDRMLRRGMPTLATIYELEQGSKEFSNHLKVRNLRRSEKFIGVNTPRPFDGQNQSFSQRAVLTSARITACVSALRVRPKPDIIITRKYNL